MNNIIKCLNVKLQGHLNISTYFYLQLLLTWISRCERLNAFTFSYLKKKKNIVDDLGVKMCQIYWEVSVYLLIYIFNKVMIDVDVKRC